MWDERNLDGTCPKEQEGIKLHIISKMGLPCPRIRMDNGNSLIDTPGNGKHIEVRTYEIHLVSQITELLINVK